MEYRDKVTIVTGGTKGIGEGCVRSFVAAGSKVVLCARNTEEGDRLSADLNKAGGEPFFLRCDVTKPHKTQSLIDETIARYGQIDCLINNAGSHPPHKP